MAGCTYKCKIEFREYNCNSKEKGMPTATAAEMALAGFVAA